MKTSRRFRHWTTTLLSVVTVVGLMVTGCSQSSTPKQTIETGTLTVGVPTFPPFIGLDGDTITGPDGAIIRAIAERLHLKIKPVSYEFSALIPALQQNRIDVALGSMFRTTERAKVINFSDPLYLEPGSLVSKTNVQTVDELVGKRVGTVQGYNWVDDVQKILGDQKLATYPSSTELKQDLEAGRLDVAIESDGTSRYLYKDEGYQINKLPKDERIQAAIHPGQTALLFNQKNTALRDSANVQIQDLHKNTTVIQDALSAAGLDPAAEKVGDPSYL